MATAGNETTKSKADAKELLLADYRYLADSFWRNEQTGETRVNWFIGIVTAASGRFGRCVNAEHGIKGGPLRFIVIMSLLGLAVFGYVTLLRIMKRNEVTDGYKRDMDSIRQLFKDNFDDSHILVGYQPFRAPRAPAAPGAEKPKKTSPEIVRRLGGLTHTVAAINSILFGGLVGVTSFSVAALNGLRSIEWWLACLLVAVSMILAWRLQMAFVDSRDSEAKEKLKAGRITHAVGLFTGSIAAAWSIFLFTRKRMCEVNGSCPRATSKMAKNIATPHCERYGKRLGSSQDYWLW